MPLRVAFLVGGDSAPVRNSIARVCNLEGVEPIAIVQDTEKDSFRRRYRNFRRNVQRQGIRFCWWRAGEALHSLTSAAVERVVPKKDIQSILKCAFPNEPFDLPGLASKYKMRLIEAGNLNGGPAAEALQALNADLGIVIGTRVLRRSTFSIPRMGCVNLHKGAVPQYRGMPAGFWEIYNSERTARVTVHQIDDDLDTGCVIETAQVEISPLDTPETLLNKLHIAGESALAEAVSRIRDGTARPIPQPQRNVKPNSKPTRRQEEELHRRLPHWRPANLRKETLKNVWMLAAYYCGLFHLARFYHGLRKSRGAVILYHRVNDLASKRDPLTTSRERFAGHMLMLSRWYKTIDTGSLVGHLRKNVPLRATSVAVHFDDCYRDVHTNAGPIMKACGVPAAILVSSGFVGTDRTFDHDRFSSPFRFENLTPQDLSSMAAAQFEIGAHTVNHVDLGAISLADAEFEIAESASQLRRLTGSPVTLFSFPFGQEVNMRRELRTVVQETGCECIFSAHGGFIDSRTDPFDIPRFAASSMHAPLALALALEGLMPNT
jgi:peptidoglycan/xylan/chitin deacetylase (PgdA/CDA1 family)